MSEERKDYIRLAFLEIVEGRYSEAAFLLAKGYAVEPISINRWEYHFSNGLVNLQSGKIGSGLDFLIEAFRLNPREPNVAKKVGEALLQLGMIKEAGYYLKRAQDIKRFDGNEDVFVFGDSHSEYCFGGVLRCKVNWLGPVTMHRIGRDGLNLCSRGVPDGSAVVLIFGEIDVRTHVFRQKYEKGRNLDDILDVLARNYLKAAVRDRDNYHHLKVAICSVMPPTQCMPDSNLPFYGSLEERVAATIALNRRLVEGCAANNLYYIDLYKYFVGCSGLLNRRFADYILHARKEFYDIVEYEMAATLGI